MADEAELGDPDSLDCSTEPVAWKEVQVVHGQISLPLRWEEEHGILVQVGQEVVAAATLVVEEKAAQDSPMSFG